MSTASFFIEIKNLVKHFDISGGLLEQLSFQGGKPHLEKTTVKAVNDVSLSIARGETLSVVGESGCGKSTLARVVMGLYPPTSGEVLYENQHLEKLKHKQWLPFRRKMQMIFQDPYASLNPRKTVRQILEEPLRFHNPDMSNSQVEDKIAQIMKDLSVHYP